MNAQAHKACYGTMFHDMLHFEANKPMRGKVFSFEVDRTGVVQSARHVTADMPQWDDCLECDEFDHCYKFCVAKLLLQTAVEHN